MTYDHTKRSFQEAVDEDPEKLNKLTEEAAELFNLIHEYPNGNRSEKVEKIHKALQGKTEKEIAIFAYFIMDMQNQQTYEMMGNMIGDIITQSMMKAADFGVPVPMMAPVAHAMGVGDMMKMMGESGKKKKNKKDKDKEKKNYGQNYIG
mgnify:CR=1 FL=1